MASWRENTPEATQDRVDTLFEECLNCAISLLGESGEFYPFGMVINQSEEVAGVNVLLDSDQPEAADVAVAVFSGLIQNRAEYLTVALTSDVKLPELETDAIKVDLEDHDGLALSILAPYHLTKRGKVKLGDFQASAGVPMVWVDPDQE